MRNSTFNPAWNCREGFDTLTLGSPSFRTHLSPLPQMAELMETRGCRWETFQRWPSQGEGVWRRVQHDSQGTCLGMGQTVALFSSLGTFHASYLPFQDMPILVSISSHAVWVQSLEVKNLDSVPAPQHLYQSTKLPSVALGTCGFPEQRVWG